MIRYSDACYQSGPHEILMGIGASATISASAPVHSIIFMRHEWSGIAEISAADVLETINLNSRLNYMQAVNVSHLTGPITVTVRGGEDYKQQAVVCGVLLA